MIKRYNTESLGTLLYQTLKQSRYYIDGKVHENGNTAFGVICPECEKPEAYVYLKFPGSIICNRSNKCGARTNTIELFNIRQNIEKDFAPTKTDPKRPARMFLESRSLNTSLKGLKYSYWTNVRKSGSGAVMFPIGTDKNGKTVFNGRLINPPPGEGKTHNCSSTSGLFWQHPAYDYDPYKTTYVVEGIIDALSLFEIGHQAIAVLASGQDPAKLELSFFKKITLAFDNDLAGARATKKWKKHFSDADSIMPDTGMDWNDLLCSGPREQVKERFKENLGRYQVNAELALAETAREYAEIYSNFHSRPPGLFEHDGCTFFAWIKKHGDSSNLVVERCGRFTLRVVSFLKDTSNDDQQYFYQLEITPKGGRPTKAIATGRDIATPRGIKEFFLTRAKVSYEGAASSAVALATRIASAKQAPEVTRIPLTGFDVKSGWYVFRDFAVDPSSKLHLPDKRGLYKINFREWSSPPPHAAEKAIKPAVNGIAPKGLHKLIVEAWKNNGTTALAWMVAGWFVYPIKNRIGFFPHLAASGDPASGKSALTVILNAIQGVDGEGTPISQLNSKKGLARTIARESGRFSALLEDSQRNERGFDYSVVLTGYNRGPLQVQAAFSNDLKTKVNEFLGTLFFVSNLEPFRDKQEKQRVISLHFAHDDITEETRQAYEQICKIPLPELARIMALTLAKRKHFEENWHQAYQQAIEDLAPLDNRRILQNHALVLAFHRLFCAAFKIEHDLTVFIKNLAEKKCVTANEKAYSLADHFFETLDLLPEEKLEACLHVDPKKSLLYLNLPAAEQLIRNKGLQFSVNDNLTKALKQHPAYIRHSLNHRFPGEPKLDNRGRPTQRRSWVFDANRFEE